MSGGKQIAAYWGGCVAFVIMLGALDRLLAC